MFSTLRSTKHSKYPGKIQTMWEPKSQGVKGGGAQDSRSHMSYGANSESTRHPPVDRPPGPEDLEQGTLLRHPGLLKARALLEPGSSPSPRDRRRGFARLNPNPLTCFCTSASLRAMAKAMLGQWATSLSLRLKTVERKDKEKKA